ncbi:class A beta-lactamase-related serine hydrolase [Candidatus Parcubacteria bacterium]|nr:class A beta-lactamase-related serine hydrolase [Candidatus Parcubacteria bacterium]
MVKVNFLGDKEFPLPLAAIMLVLFGFAGGWLFDCYFQNQKTPVPQVQAVRQGGYELINPLLFYDVSNSTELEEYEPLKKELTAFINNKISAGKATKISLYFRGLLINSSEKYAPASLMKVPTMISILKYAEEHPEILSRKVFYDGVADYNSNESIKPLKQIQGGNYYTVDELLLYMIAYSDNNAAQLLLHQLDLDYFYKVFTDLGVAVPPKNFDINNFDYMDVKSYASFFRVLYNATYLSRSMSEKAFKLLAYNDFPQGIESGLPIDVNAAQKFGEAMIVDRGNKILAVELHDCGWVYASPRPYLLCIMTSGSNFLDLENTISGLSSIIYNTASKTP